MIAQQRAMTVTGAQRRERPDHGLQPPADPAHGGRAASSRRWARRPRRDRGRRPARARHVLRLPLPQRVRAARQLDHAWGTSWGRSRRPSTSRRTAGSPPRSTGCSTRSPTWRTTPRARPGARWSSRPGGASPSSCSQLDATVAPSARTTRSRRCASRCGQVNDLTSRIAEPQPADPRLRRRRAGARPTCRTSATCSWTSSRTWSAVRVLQREDGTIGVLAGDTMLVDGGGCADPDGAVAGWRRLRPGHGRGQHGGPEVGQPEGADRPGHHHAARDPCQARPAGPGGRHDRERDPPHRRHRGAAGPATDFFDPAGVDGAVHRAVAPRSQASADAIAARDRGPGRRLGGPADRRPRQRDQSPRWGAAASGTSTPTSPARSART